MAKAKGPQRPPKTKAPPHREPVWLRKRAQWGIVGTVALLMIIVGGALFVASDTGARRLLFGSSAIDLPPRFVGSENCVGCHRAESDLWGTSQHKHAMAHATGETVLGDFNDARFELNGVQSRFFRRDGKFLVETDGPDGKLATFEAKYTFGLDPLQQYLIEFPDGRLQALSIAWDSRPKDKGGQRWFHLYPDEKIASDDVLHWTKLNQNWNFMCSECHSTGVRKNYDAAADGFKTSWAEISVGCEACHGQGSRHVGWAKSRQSWWPFGKSEDAAMGLLVRYAERLDVTWKIDPKTGNAARSVPPATLRKEVESCGFCHARRGQLSEDWVPGRWLSETHNVSTLSRGLYHADGQMQDEVYNYGSFKQSKMFAAGVTCSDCHDPHSAKPRYAGDTVCLQCHAPDKYSAASHNQHADAKPAPGCASCHMPTRTYMVVDPRHDHSFRIPRPDLSVRLGTPNACNDCHADKTAQWAAAAVERWFGPDRKGFQKHAAAFHAAWNGQEDAGLLLARAAADGTAPAITRASALTELSSIAPAENVNLARASLSHPDPMVRIGALDMIERIPATQVWEIASPLLSDPVRGVRIRAAAVLAVVPTARQPASDRDRFDRAAGEFVAAQRLNADRPEARSSLATFLARRGQLAEAESEYRAAIRLSAQYAPAAVNLADLYRQMGREADGEAVLQAALKASPRDAGLHHVLGLTLVRLKQLDRAVAELREATELDQQSARYAYVYAVALHTAGQRTEAIGILRKIVEQHPRDRDALMGLISFHREAGEIAMVLQYAEKLAVLTPGDVGLNTLIEGLRQQVANPNPR